MPTLRELIASAGGNLTPDQVIARITAASKAAQSIGLAPPSVPRYIPTPQPAPAATPTPTPRPMATPMPTATPYPPQAVPVSGYRQPIMLPGALTQQVPRPVQLPQPGQPTQRMPYMGPELGISPKVTGREIVGGTALAGMGLLAAVQPELIPVMLALGGLSQSAALPGVAGVPGKAFNYPFQQIEKQTARVIPEETGIPLAVSLALPIAAGIGAKAIAPKIAGAIPEGVKTQVGEGLLAGEEGGLKLPWKQGETRDQYLRRTVRQGLPEKPTEPLKPPEIPPPEPVVPKVPKTPEERAAAAKAAGSPLSMKDLIQGEKHRLLLGPDQAAAVSGIIGPELPKVPVEVAKAAEAVSPKESAAIHLLAGDADYVPPTKGVTAAGAAGGGKKPIAPIRIASTIGNDIMNAWNAVVRPAALRPVKVQGALENYATNLESTQFDAGLLTRRLARDHRTVGFDTKAIVNKVEGGAKAQPNLRGKLVDIIENGSDYKVNAAQLKAINNEQAAAHDWIALQNKRGADISEIMTNYVRHVVDFEGSIPSSVLKQRRFPTLRELQAWIDENPELHGKIRTLDWAELRQSSFEAVGRAGDRAEFLRELAPLRWIKQRGARGRAARPPEGYRRVNLPEPFQGKTVVIVERGKPPVTTRVGDWYLPDEAAAALESQLGPLPGFLEPVGEMVEAARGITLNLDFSIGTQFGANKLMGDPVGSLTQLRPMARGLTSAKGYLDVLEEEAPFVKMFLKGGGRLSGRFGEAVAGGEPKDILSRTIPGLQKLNDIQFTRIMGLGKLFSFKSQLKMLMGMREIATKLPIPNPVKGWTDEQIIRGAARASMNEFGSIDYTQIGAGSVRRLVERLGFLTPGFLRAFVGLFAKTPSAVLGDPQGIAQAVFLAQYVGYMSVITDAMSYAMGGGWQGAEHYDPRSSKFMTVVTPQGTFSPAGQIRTYAKLLANLPEDLLAGNMDRIQFFMQSRESQPLRHLHEQLTGRDLFGYPVETELVTGKALTGIKAIDRFIAAAEKQLPIAGQTLMRSVREGGMAPETAEGVTLSSLGLNFWPTPIRAKLDAAAQDKYTRPWRELEPFEKNNLLALHPDLQAEADADLKDRVLRGDKYAVREEMRGSIFDDFAQLIGDIPDKSNSRKEWRELYTKYAAQREAALAAIDRQPEFAKIAKRLGEREPATGNQKLLAEYNAIFARNRDPKTGTRTPEQETKMFEELDKFEATHTPQQMAVIDRNSGLTAPPWLKQLRSDRKEIEGYWQLGDVGWGIYAKQNGISMQQYPTYDDFRADLEKYATDNNMTTAIVDTLPVIKNYVSGLSSAKQAMREGEPLVDAILAYWGYNDTVRTKAAAQLYYDRYGEMPRMAQQ